LTHALKYAFRYKNLTYTERPFSFLVGEVGVMPDDSFRTLVMEQEPVEHFPDDARNEFTEMLSEPSHHLLQEIVGSDEIPEEWFVRMEGRACRGVMTAPASIVGRWCSVVNTDEIGRYYGRVLPLFRCLRRYPLPGPWIPRAEGHPKARYICYVQYRRQVQAMQALLDDREAVAGLLAADLLDVAGGKPDRYEPRFSPTVDPVLASRLGLWFDGGSYRFLLFDSEHDRRRWLDGEDWTDVPSDIDNYQWPTDEEWQKQLEEMNMDVDESADGREQIDINGDWAPDSLKQTDTEAHQPARDEE